jgi:hypothetical protein
MCMFLAVGLQTSSFASILPPNDLHLQDNLFRRVGGISAQEFDSVIDRAVELYGPIVENRGGKLQILRLWTDPTVNAYADRAGNTWTVGMFGGLARRPEVTVDGFTLVVCHELGHHLAGFPMKAGRWAATEGQSDYFATLSCGRMFWGDDKETNATYRKKIPAASKQLCDKKYDDRDDQNLCYRQMMAGMSLATLLSKLGESGSVKFETPNDSVVSVTYEGHPEAQCRLDTYVAGSICKATWDEQVVPGSEQESANYTCNMAQGFQRESRPRCWFKPNL